jgi:prepilin-type processing-associated H-X9-DG protein
MDPHRSIGALRGMFNRNGVGRDISAPGVRISDVTDGLSQTLMIGEAVVKEHGDIHDFDNWAHPNGGNSHCSTIVPINYKTDHVNFENICEQPERNTKNPTVSWGFKSKHSGGVNFSLADGSVRFVSETIDHRTYQLLGCRHDGQPVEMP